LPIEGFIVSVADVQDSARNPAADRSRMWLALGVLAVLGVLAWFTLDGNAELPVREFGFGSFRFGGFGMKVRWIPELILGLFAVRVVTANMRARLEDNDRPEGEGGDGAEPAI
jgi:hypothetical protein